MKSALKKKLSPGARCQVPGPKARGPGPRARGLGSGVRGPGPEPGARGRARSIWYKLGWRARLRVRLH